MVDGNDGRWWLIIINGAISVRWSDSIVCFWTQNMNIVFLHHNFGKRTNFCQFISLRNLKEINKLSIQRKLRGTAVAKSTNQQTQSKPLPICNEGFNARNESCFQFLGLSKAFVTRPLRIPQDVAEISISAAVNDLAEDDVWTPSNWTEWVWMGVALVVFSLQTGHAVDRRIGE